MLVVVVMVVVVVQLNAWDFTVAFAEVHDHRGCGSAVAVGSKGVCGCADRTASRPALDERHMAGMHFIYSDSDFNTGQSIFLKTSKFSPLNIN